MPVINITPAQQSILSTLVMGAIEHHSKAPLPEFDATKALAFAKDMIARDEEAKALDALLLAIKSAKEVATSAKITIADSIVFKNADSSALLVHLSDGQTYRVGLDDDEQKRIGMEGLKYAFPKELLDLDDDAAARAVVRGAITGKPVAYRVTESKVINPTTKKPYTNVRLTPNLAEATEAQVAKIMGPSSDIIDVGF